MRRTCFYCDLPLRDPDVPDALALSWFGNRPGGPGSRKLLRHLRTTDEHLVRKANGGLDDASNLTRAHNYCNTTRGERSVSEHRAFTLRSLSERSYPFSAFQPKRPRWPSNVAIFLVFSTANVRIFVKLREILATSPGLARRVRE